MQAGSFSGPEPGETGPACVQGTAPPGANQLILKYTLTYFNEIQSPFGFASSQIRFELRLKAGTTTLFTQGTVAGPSLFAAGACTTSGNSTLCEQEFTQTFDISALTPVPTSVSNPLKAPTAAFDGSIPFASTALPVELYVTTQNTTGTPRDNDSVNLDGEVTIVSQPLSLRSAYGAGTQAGVDDLPPGGTGMETKQASTAAVTASYPLGSLFYLQVVKADGTPVKSTFNLAQGTISPALPGPSLFSNSTVIMFSSDGPQRARYFRAVHLGTAEVTIKPDNNEGPEMTVSITVTRPSRLGSLGRSLIRNLRISATRKASHRLSSRGTSEGNLTSIDLRIGTNRFRGTASQSREAEIFARRRLIPTTVWPQPRMPPTSCHWHKAEV